MRNFFHILYQPYKWLIVIPFLVLSTLFLGTVAIVIATTVSPKLASATCGVWWARLNSFLTPMLVSVRGRRHIDKKQSYVIISNHLSHYDIFVLYGWLGVDFKWVMKKELRNVPGVGIACHRLGHIFIDRSNHAAAIATLEQAKSKIVDGTSVIFFPEGTRSRDGKLKAFKKGAFRMAVDLGLPILPLTVTGTRNVLPAGTSDLMPGSAQLIIHPPVTVDGCDPVDCDRLRNEVRDVIASRLPNQT